MLSKLRVKKEKKKYRKKKRCSSKRSILEVEQKFLSYVHAGHT